MYIKNWIIYIDDTKTVTYYKWKFYIKNLNQLSEWMYFFDVHDRKELDIKFDKHAFIMWLSIYQEFDENDWKIKSYLYKYSKDNIKNTNKLFDHLWIDYHVDVTWKFVELMWDILPVSLIEKEVDKWIGLQNYNSIFSFLFWISFVYWNFNIKNDILNSLKIIIPVWWLLNKHKNIIENSFKFLTKNWFYSIVDINNKKIWFNYQISIKDWETLDIFKIFLNNLWLTNIDKNSSHNLMIKLKDQLICFIDNIDDDWKHEVISRLNIWILKYKIF